MKNFKLRFISAILVSVMCLVFNVQAYSSEKLTDSFNIVDYTEQTIYDEAYSYLNMMGIISDNGYHAAVTRGIAISTIIRACGYESMALSSANSIYTYDEKMASFAHEQGMLAGTVPSEWDLNSYITVPQLCKIFTVALGYDGIINSADAFPAKYIVKASELGLTKYLQSPNSNTLSYDDFIVMLYLAMNTTVLQITGVTNEELIYNRSENYCLEDVYLRLKNLKKSEGIVEADYYASTVKNEYCKNSQILINGIYYNCISEQCKDLVGMNVEYVYENSKAVSGINIIGIHAKNTNKIYSFTRKNDVEYNDGKFAYYDNSGKEKNINLSEGAVFIYNNKIMTSYDFNNFNFSDLYIRMIDNNDDNEYDVVFAKNSESIIVNYVKNDKIYIKTGQVHSKKLIDLQYNEDVSLVIYKFDGTPAAISDIKENSAISVIASLDFKYIEIILLDEEKQGNFEGLDSQNNIVTVDGVEYGLKLSAHEFALGGTYRFLVNEYNEIFHMESVFQNCQYIVDVSLSSQSLDSSSKIKIYDGENGLQIYDFAKKVNIDGTSHTAVEAVGAAQTRTLAYVTLNNENQVKKIEYLDSYVENGQRKYCEHASGFNDMANEEITPFTFDKKTVFFYVPNDNNDDGFGFVIPLKDGDEYLTQAFEYNELTGCAGAVVVNLDTDVRENSQLTYRSDIAIVKSISQIVDVDMQAVYKITAYHKGELHTYYSGHYTDVFSVCAKLKAGDVISYVENYNNEIVRLKLLRSLSEADEYFHDGRDTTEEQFFGQVITLKKKVLTNSSKYLIHQMSVSTTSDYNNLVHMTMWADTDNPYDSSSEFADWYSYNFRTKEVTPISVDDIITYENAGSGATEIFVQRVRSDVKFVVVIEDRQEE